MSYTNRTITENVLTGLDWVQKRTYQGVTTNWDGTHNQSSMNLVTVKSGSSNPQWKTQVKTGNSAGTAYSLTGYRADTSQGGIVVFRYYNGSGSSKVTMEDTLKGFNFSQVLPSSYVATFNKAETAALLQVYRKIDQAANQWKGLKFFAEFSDVIRQFGHPAKAIVEFTLHHLDKTKHKVLGLKGVQPRYRRQKVQKVLADSYLEYCFGLAPLISDSKKAAEALARYNYEGDPTNNPSLRTRAVGRGSELVVKDSTFSKVLASNSKLYTNIIGNQRSEARVQYIVGLSTAAKADFGSLEHFRKLLGFTPAKLPAAAWEAVPWSWLVDYFSNVGDVLDSVGVDTSSVKWIVRTTVMVDEYESIAQVDVPGSKSLAAAYGYSFESITGNKLGEWKVRKTTFNRSIPSTLGWPSFQWELPIGDEHLAGKFSNLVAVLVQKRGELSAVVAGVLAGAAALF